MRELDVMTADVLIIVVIFRQHQRAYLLGQFDLMLYVIIRIRHHLNLIVIFVPDELNGIPILLQLQHLTPQQDRVLLPLLLLYLAVDVKLLHALHAVETDLQVAHR